MARSDGSGRVVRAYKDGTCLYGWRPTLGTKEVTGKGPGGEANLLKFRAHVLEAREAGREPQHPSIVLAPLGSTRVIVPTLREWIGLPNQQKHGEYFTHAKAMGRGREMTYESNFRLHGPFDLIGDVPMDKVDRSSALLVISRALRCAACLERAKSEGRAVTDAQIRADRPVRNGPCPTHRPERLKDRTSVLSFIALLSAAWNVAITAEKVTSNPFTSIDIGYWDEPKTDDDLRVALTMEQLNRVVMAHPEELRVIPVLSTAAMLRAGEMWGLQRKDFPVPPVEPDEDVSQLTFQLVRVWDQATRTFRPYGNAHKQLGSITVGSQAVKAVNDHLRDHMAASDTCEACRSTPGVWRSSDLNPHQGCGYADDAPLISESLCKQDHYSKKKCREVQVAAKLQDLPFAITHKCFRSSGATWYLHSGTNIAQVCKMGRWSNQETLLNHYHRLYGEAHSEAIERAELLRQAELGLDTTEAAPIDGRLRFAERQLKHTAEELEALRAENDALRAGLGIPQRTEPSEIIPIATHTARASKWREVSDEQLVAIIDAATSQREILENIGVSVATKNYTRLRSEADRLGVTLPGLWDGMRRNAKG